MNRFKLLYGGSIVALAALAAALGAALVLSAIGASPAATFVTIFTGPFKDVFGLTEILVRAVPLILVALGIAIAFRSGIINIGAEGQMLMGILAATATALALPTWPKAALLPLVILAGALGGALWAGIAGLLRARLGVNEILSTVMLNYIAAQFYTFFLRGPMIDPGELETGSGTPQSMRLPEAAFLDRIVPGTRLHMGLVLALALCVCVWFFLWRTTWGFRLRAAGAEAKAARYAGIHVPGSLVAAMCLSGAFAGIAGAVEVCGVHHRAIENITSGYGFAGIVVALFGALHPAGIVPAAFFFGLLLVGSDMTQRSAGVPANMILVLMGVLILCIVSAKMYLNNPYAQERAARFFARFRTSGAGEPS
ncbi:ABC transporter permease [Mesoterricola silvestris]|uniref:ABC transporter permease n=1 Tax=Mesoterricola silvestris TaxID=2927979 RepID=A0AA48GVN5_9BACT|nr:ABC transporter permease [Mesoterricola silvestris]BDU74912.1 ABC transporter permease [Mesoterricola silvestris]